MRTECLRAVAQALGRELNQAEARDLEGRLREAAKRIAQTDPKAWMAKSKGEKLTESAQAAAIELIGETRKKAEREALSIAAWNRLSNSVADAKAADVNGLDALDRINAFHSDGKTDVQSVESRADAISKDFLRQLIPVMEASNPKWFGLLENQEGVETIIRAMHGEKTGNAAADAGAKIWKEVAEAARQRFNRNGGDIGKLDDWAMAQHHSQVRVARAGQDAWRASLARGAKLKAAIRDLPPPKDLARDTWVSDVLPLLKREKYVNDDGSAMTDAELTDFLREAWLTIATGGANKVKPGQFKGGGARANRGNASRQIHFKDAKSFIEYQGKYGEKELYEILTGHIENVAKDIALVETYGPNPDHMYRLFRDQAVKLAKEDDPARSGKVDERAVSSDNLYNVVSGKTQPIASERLAKGFDTLRGWLTASRLGGAAISSITDEGTLHLTSRLNQLPQLRLVANELAAFNPANKAEERRAMRAGLALNTFIATLNRFGQQSLGSSFSKKLGTTVLRMSGLNAMTEARRRAFGVTAMGALGEITRTHAKLSDAHAQDVRLLKNKGVTDEDFRVWKEAHPEDWGDGNATMLTPDSIYRIDDATLDKAIGPRIQKIKDKTSDELAKLATRDLEDQGWVAKRAAKLSQWVRDAQHRVDERIQKADANTKANLQDLKAKLSRLDETVEGARASWDTPPNADTPGINGAEEVRFYGKGKLRALGLDEGKARAAMRHVSREATAVKKAFERTKVAELNDLLADFNERKTELDEFSKESQARIGRRAKVADRIRTELLPSIADARTDAREQAVTKLLGLVLEETNMAVIEPGAKERAFMHGAGQRGTWRGELARSFWLFKSFPVAMLMRHWNRALAQPTGGGRAKYLAALIASTTILGAVSMQIKELLAGRDPRNLNPFAEHGTRNWLKAMLQGGSLGMYGDFLFSESTQQGQSPVASALGPAVGLGEDVFKLTQGNVMQAMAGEDTHAGAESVKFVRNNLPGGNLWYTKAIMDHMIWNQLAEFMSPGYLSKVRRRAQREFGQEYFWSPEDALPSRAPDFSAVAGK